MVKLWETDRTPYFTFQKGPECCSKVRELPETPPIQTLPVECVWFPVQIKAWGRAPSVKFYLCGF